MTDILLGGVIALSSALTVQVVVQVFIVPRVQAAIRRHDRWEKNLIELAALVEDELPRALKDFHFATIGLRHVTAMESNPEYDQDKVKAWKTEEDEKQRAADQVLGEVLARANRLERYLRLVRPDSPYWKELWLRLISMKVNLFTVDRHTHDKLDDDAFRSAWDKVNTAGDRLRDKIGEITATMKPPPRRVVRRARAWGNGQVKRLRGNSKSAATAVQPPSAIGDQAAA